MSLGVDGLLVAYVIVALLLLWLNLYSRWPWQIKAGSIVTMTVAYFVLYNSLPLLQGWPTEEGIPKKFRLLAVHIHEPNAVTGHAGGIFFWGIDMQPGTDSRPRAYHLPVTPQFKAIFQSAKGKLRENIPQVGEIEDEEAPFGAPKTRLETGQKSLKIKIKDAPVREGVPIKDAPQ